MARSVTAIVTTVAVLWHGVAGCCAHHRHGGTGCDGRRAAHQSVVRDAGVKVDHPCGPNGRTVAEASCATESPCPQFAGGASSAPCSADPPRQCPDGPCVFAAPSQAGPPLADQRDGPCSSLAWVAPALTSGDASAGETRQDVAPPSLGGLRLHLVHRVLTL